MAKPEKPDEIAANPVASRMWDELTAEVDFSPGLLPLLSAYCTSYASYVESKGEITRGDGTIQTVYETPAGKLEKLPQVDVSTAKSSEMLRLAKALGLMDKREAKGVDSGETANVIGIQAAKRAQRRARAANQG